jgi:hypothetical protein
MKTAVEWLEWQLGAYIKGNIDELTLDDYYFLVGIAKEMEKEQIGNAYYYDPNCGEIKDDGEQYYNETFKQQQQ